MGPRKTFPCTLPNLALAATRWNAQPVGLSKLVVARLAKRTYSSSFFESASPKILLPPPLSTPLSVPTSFSLNALTVRLVKPDEKPQWRSLMQQYHYLGFKGMVGESLLYVATVFDHWVALIGWGAAAWKCQPREAWIGWNENLKLKRLYLIANNVRFLILPGISMKNLASKILALNLKRLSSDWENRYHHPLLLVETFVDLARFKGTCYLAAGFLPLGKTKGFTKHRQGYLAHGNPKLLLVKPLDPKARQKLSGPFPVVSHPTLKEESMTIDINHLPLSGEGSLMELLRTLSDPRKPRGVRHSFVSILAISICAALSGMRSFAAIGEWANSLSVETLEKLGCTRKTPPVESTIRRTLQKIDANAFDEKIGAWLIATAGGLKNKQVCIDGKTLCGSGDGNKKPLHLLSGILAQEGFVIAQREVGEKTNEIPEVKPLLEPLPLEGAVVTGDAMHTQKETARFVVKEKQADYLLTVKDNQPRLKAEIESLGQRLMSFSPSSEFAG